MRQVGCVWVIWWGGLLEEVFFVVERRKKVVVGLKRNNKGGRRFICCLSRLRVHGNCGVAPEFQKSSYAWWCKGRFAKISR